MYGVQSSCWKLFAATYAVPGSQCDTSMMEMRAKSGRSFGVTRVHVLPPSGDTCTSPSSLPTHRTSFFTGDSAIAKIVPYVSTPVWSLVIGPPDGPRVMGSLRARGGEMRAQLCPSFIDFHNSLPPTYSARGLCGEKTIGYVHWKRCVMSSDEWPIGFHGHGCTLRSKPVFISFLVSRPP